MLAVARAHAPTPADAEEVFQESAMRAWSELKQLTNPEKFLAWTCSIIQNAARDRGRRAKLRAAAPLPELPAPTEEPSEGKRRAILQAVESLEPAQREVIELFYFGGLTYREISELIGKSVPTVNLRLADARDALRGRLHNHADVI